MNKSVKYFCTIVMFSSLFCSNLLQSEALIYNSVLDLNDVKKQLASDEESNTFDPKSTLVIFDIDDTLLESVNFVGSGKWYTWQRGRAVQNMHGQSFRIQEKEQFYCIFRTLGTLFEIGSTQLTQTDAVQVINTMKVYDLMLLTSRTTTYRAATERELKKNKIDLDKQHLSKSNQIFSYSLNDGNRTAKITYENGIVMSSGLNKGLVLRSILKKLDKNYQQVYFVDDSLKNIKDMAKEWQNDSTKVNIFHYTRVDKSISKEEINESISAKSQFDGFLKVAYPDRYKAFQKDRCL